MSNFKTIDGRSGAYVTPFRIPDDVVGPDPTLAVCKTENIPTSVFFIENERTYPQLVSDAKQFCARCPVREACLDYALALNLYSGIYGGRTGSERARMRKVGRKLLDRQQEWDIELHTKNWHAIALEIGLPRNWRRKVDPPEWMIDSDSVYFRTGDGKLGCRFKRNGCFARFETLEECFRHAHDPQVIHRRVDLQPQED